MKYDLTKLFFKNRHQMSRIDCPSWAVGMGKVLVFTFCSLGGGQRVPRGSAASRKDSGQR